MALVGTRCTPRQVVFIVIEHFLFFNQVVKKGSFGDIFVFFLISFFTRDDVEAVDLRTSKP